MEVLTVGIIGALKLVLTRRFPALVKLVVVVVLALYLMALPGLPGSRARRARVYQSSSGESGPRRRRDGTSGPGPPGAKQMAQASQGPYALSLGDVQHYQRIVVVLSETRRPMREVDEAMPGWPLG